MYIIFLSISTLTGKIDIITDYDINDTPFKLEGDYFTKYREDFKNAVNEEINELLRTILRQKLEDPAKLESVEI